MAGRGAQGAPVTARRWVVLFAAVLAAALTARLGFWQLDRAAQKNAIHAAMEARRALPPLDARALAGDAAGAAAQEHRAVRLDGVWLAAHTVYLENRPMSGRTGFLALTPLALDGGRSVLVQRGWLPRDMADRTRIVAPPPPAGRVRVEGRVALGPSRLVDLAPGAAASGPIRQNVVPADFARETGLDMLPLVVVQEDAAQATADGLLRQWPAPAADVHKHYGYAFQWFALCALVLALYVWFQVLRPRTRRADGA
jgi:surfeit locus 1 family protein